MKKVKHVLLALSVIGAGVLSQGSAQAATCTVGFNDWTGLQILPPAQAYGFASSFWYYHWCNSMGWWFNLDENGGSLVGHYHIPAQDPNISCFTTNATWPEGVFGKQVGAVCNAVNPLTTDRTAFPHQTTYWIRIRNTTSTTFWWRPIQIRILGSVAGKVLVEHTDGTWWQYINLTPGLWNLGVTGKKAKNAWIMNNSTADGMPVNFDELKVEGPI